MGFSPSFVKLRASQSERDKVWIDLKFSRQFYYICSAFAREAAHKRKGVRFPLILCLRRQKSQLCNLPGIILSKVTCRDFLNRKNYLCVSCFLSKIYAYLYLYRRSLRCKYRRLFSAASIFICQHNFFSRAIVKFLRESHGYILEIRRDTSVEFSVRVIGFLTSINLYRKEKERKKKNTKPWDT